METKVHYTVVGAFVIALIAAVTLTIIWLSSGFSFETYQKYTVHMTESVSGLNLDAPVEFNGVNVGSVKKIEISKHNPQLVNLLLYVKSHTPITQGTEATLAMRGITGIAFVALKDKGNDTDPLTAIGKQPYPVIKTVPSLFTRLDTTLNQLTTNFKAITETFQSLFDPENRQAIKVSLENIKVISNNLATHSQKFNTILDNTAKATARFAPLLQSSTTAMQTLEMQTLPTMYNVLNNLNDMTKSLADVAQELKDNPSVLIRGAAPSNLGPGERRQ